MPDELEKGIIGTVIAGGSALIILTLKKFWELFASNREDLQKQNKEYREDLQKQIKDLKEEQEKLIKDRNKEREKSSDYKALSSRLLTLCETHKIDVEDSKKEYNKLSD